jgi:hypothetical protein
VLHDGRQHQARRVRAGPVLDEDGVGDLDVRDVDAPVEVADLGDELGGQATRVRAAMRVRTRRVKPHVKATS